MKIETKQVIMQPEPTTNAIARSEWLETGLATNESNPNNNDNFISIIFFTYLHT